MKKREKEFAVLFTESNARIYVGPAVEKVRSLKGVLITPDLSQVKRIPPHFWKLEKGKIVPMNEVERAERIKLIEAKQPTNKIDGLQKKISKKKVALELGKAAGYIGLGAMGVELVKYLGGF